MDQPFQRKKAASREETTTIRHTLLSPTEGKTTVKVSVILSNINLSYSFLLRYYIDFNTRWLSGVVRSCQELSGVVRIHREGIQVPLTITYLAALQQELVLLSFCFFLNEPILAMYMPM